MNREATLDDVATIARLSTIVYPAELTTARSLCHRWASVPARTRRRMWLAEEGGDALGFAAAGLAHTSTDPGAAVAISYPAVDLDGRLAANAFTGTLPEFRGRGLARLVKLAVNTRLGYRPHSQRLSWLKELS